MRGVVWYQGESNTGQADKYETLLREWMADWRGRFGSDASFLIVQLANFGQPPTQPVESGWAGVREAQRLAKGEADQLQPSRDPSRLAEDLCRALLTPRDEAEMARLLADLCTPAEVRTRLFAHADAARAWRRA